MAKYKPSRPRQAKGGIKAQTRRGAFGESWWARRWIDVLEGFDIGARLSRGRSYARGGQVRAKAMLEAARGMISWAKSSCRRSPRPYPGGWGTSHSGGARRTSWRQWSRSTGGHRRWEWMWSSASDPRKNRKPGTYRRERRRLLGVAFSVTASPSGFSPSSRYFAKSFPPERPSSIPASHSPMRRA